MQGQAVHQEREKFFWADRLRNIATILVIAIHIAAPIAHGYPDLDTWWWWTGNWWNSLSRPAVPLFVMLSGYLLLSKDYPLPVFLKKRFSRIIIPALFWMSVYLLYNYIAKGDPATLWDAVKRIVSGPVHYHLWFIYLIIGLYLVYPILRAWVKTASEQDLLYFLILCAIGTWGYKLLYEFGHISIGIYFELAVNNAGYFVLGYYLGTKSASDDDREGMSWRFTRRQLAQIGLALVVIGTASTATLSYWFGHVRGQNFNFFYDYLTPNVSISAAGWFLLVKSAFNTKPLLPIEKDFAAASFGIYFVHVLVIDWWAQCGYWHSKVHPFKGIPVIVGIVTIMSFLVIAFLREMPGGKKIT
ncbi:MAG TPA: acyltransferase family protein [Saprospiraceae bacterium]|nr:acyltransferase family protein [Saprospiraceae bacterium]